MESGATVENSGDDVPICRKIIVSADMTFTADSSVKMWRFKKTTYVPWDAQDPGVHLHEFGRATPSTP